MAKTPVKLTVDGYAEREVLMYTYEFERPVGIDGQATGITRGGYITIKVKALNDGKPDLLAWLVEKTLAKKGKIEINDNLENKLIKTIQFEGAYCVNFDEKWVEGEGHTEVVTLSCQKLDINGAKYENDWN